MDQQLCRGVQSEILCTIYSEYDVGVSYAHTYTQTHLGDDKVKMIFDKISLSFGCYLSLSETNRLFL